MNRRYSIRDRAGLEGHVRESLLESLLLPFRFGLLTTKNVGRAELFSISLFLAEG